LVVAVIGLAIAVTVPSLWWAVRPSESAGTPVDSVSPGRTADPLPPTSTRTASLSTQLSVPSLGIDAPIVAVGVRSDSSMAIPDQVREVGWYRFGPAPGSTTGAAVLAGHVDSAEQGKGALFGLRRIAIGSRITVTLESGAAVRYRVTGRELFVKRRLPTERLFTRDGAPRLVIITCGGPFIRKLSSYRDNLVVAAEPL
jgi:hypothetical protein